MSEDETKMATHLAAIGAVTANRPRIVDLDTLGFWCPCSRLRFAENGDVFVANYKVSHSPVIPGSQEGLPRLDVCVVMCCLCRE